MLHESCINDRAKNDLRSFIKMYENLVSLSLDLDSNIFFMDVFSHLT